MGEKNIKLRTLMDQPNIINNHLTHIITNKKVHLIDFKYFYFFYQFKFVSKHT